MLTAHHAQCSALLTPPKGHLPTPQSLTPPPLFGTCSSHSITSYLLDMHARCLGLSTSPPQSFKNSGPVSVFISARRQLVRRERRRRHHGCSQHCSDDRLCHHSIVRLADQMAPTPPHGLRDTHQSVSTSGPRVRHSITHPDRTLSSRGSSTPTQSARRRIGCRSDTTGA